MRQISLSIWFIFALLAAIGGLVIGTFAGIIQWGDITGQLVAFIFVVIIIAFLAVIGAAFVGMFISHRILSNKGFTPFEQSMLEMADDVKKINKRLDALEKAIEAMQFQNEKK